MTNMIIHLLRLKVCPRSQSNTIRTIQLAIGPTKVRHGCLSCSFCSHVDNDDELLLMQKWASDEALDKYLASPTYSLLVEGLELALEKPVVEFQQVSSTEGVEHIEDIRQAAEA